MKQPNFYKEIREIKEEKNWKESLYEQMRHHIAEELPLPEDQRSGDWRFLLPHHHFKNTLVWGGGWGTIPMSLTQISNQVFVVDPNPDKICLLQSFEVPKLSIHPSFKGIPPLSFDLISVPDPSHPLSQLLTHVVQFLKKDGILHLNLKNSLNPLTLFILKKKLHQEGFSKIDIYAPLPRPHGIPLFLIPFYNNKAWVFFFKNIFPLFAAVSPEMKKLYALEYQLARFGVKIALLLGLTSLAKYFSPGFTIIATRTA